MKKLFVIALVILAIISGVVAVVYLTQTAGNLPHFYPGYLKGSSNKHLKHGVVFVGLAVVFLLGAWMASGNSANKPDSEKIESDNN
jgi:ABC-type transporter Mla subunit MlaD